MTHHVVAYGLPLDAGLFSLEMPRGAELLGIYAMDNHLYLHALVASAETEVEQRALMVLPTNKRSDIVEHARYIGSGPVYSEMMHVFERSTDSLSERVAELERKYSRIMAAYARGG